MPEFVTVLLLAMLPGVGNVIGGILAETVQVTEIWLNPALHAAAGVVMAVVAVEIFPEALGVASGWTLGVAFATGGLLYLLVEAAVERRTSGQRSRMWMIYLAVATDLFSDGLMLGAGTAVSPGLGLVIAAGQLLADLPEGFASIATFQANDVPRRRRLLLSLSFLAPVLISSLALSVAGSLVRLRDRNRSTWGRARPWPTRTRRPRSSLDLLLGGRRSVAIATGIRAEPEPVVSVVERRSRGTGCDAHATDRIREAVVWTAQGQPEQGTGCVEAAHLDGPERFDLPAVAGSSLGGRLVCTELAGWGDVSEARRKVHRASEDIPRSVNDRASCDAAGHLRHRADVMEPVAGLFGSLDGSAREIETQECTVTQCLDHPTADTRGRDASSLDKSIGNVEGGLVTVHVGESGELAEVQEQYGCRAHTVSPRIRRAPPAAILFPLPPRRSDVLPGSVTTVNLVAARRSRPKRPLREARRP